MISQHQHSGPRGEKRRAILIIEACEASAWRMGSNGEACGAKHPWRGVTMRPPKPPGGPPPPPTSRRLEGDSPQGAPLHQFPFPSPPCTVLWAPRITLFFLLFVFYICLSVCRPDMTFAVDWASKNNDLSIYPFVILLKATYAENSHIVFV